MRRSCPPSDCYEPCTFTSTIVTRLDGVATFARDHRIILAALPVTYFIATLALMTIKAAT